MQEDTLHLLQECASGTDMAIRSLDDVLSGTQDDALRQVLLESKRRHEQLAGQTQQLLQRAGKPAKPANPAARTMSWMKTNAKLTFSPGNATIAELVSDGCSMGIRSLARCCNQYPAAGHEAHALARSLIAAEDELVMTLRSYL